MSILQQGGVVAPSHLATWAVHRTGNMEMDAMTTTMTVTSYSRTTGLLTAFNASDVLAITANAY